MSSLLLTIDNVVSQIRSQLDELNRDSVSTEDDILPCINRAQDFAFDILAKKYPEPILAYSTLVLSAGEQEYDIPEDVFEDRIEKLEIVIPGGSQSTYRQIERISYRDITDYETPGRNSVPYYYAIIGRKIRFVPGPTGTYNARMWFLRNPEKLVLQQGRITHLGLASNYLIVDSTGDSLTTESDQLGSYVNVVDGQTGVIKGSLQIQSVASNKVTFRTVPTRSTVLNRAISGSLTDVNPAQDDYLSPIDGTCVPYFGKPVTNFLIQFAVAELVRKLGGESDKEETVLDKFEKQVSRTWAGRETTLRIKKRSRIWRSPVRRWQWE